MFGLDLFSKNSFYMFSCLKIAQPKKIRGQFFDKLKLKYQFYFII